MKTTHDQAPKPRNHENLGSELAQAGEARADSCPRKLSAGAHKPPLRDYLARHPLASEERYSRNLEEGLTHLVVIGDSVLGISRDYNRKKNDFVGSSVDNPVESIRVSVLPLGPAARETQTSRTLLAVRTAQLRNPRADGMVQGWESVVVGRDTLAQATGAIDPTVSRRHVEIVVTGDGEIGVTDLDSTNGTQVLSVDDYGMAGLSGQDRQVLVDTTMELQQKPYMWDQQHADSTARIIDPS